MAAKDNLSSSQFSWTDDGMQGSMLDERYRFDPSGPDRRRAAGIVEHGVDIEQREGRYHVGVGSNRAAYDRDRNFEGDDTNVEYAEGRPGGYRTLRRAQTAGAGIASRRARDIAEEPYTD